SRRIDADCPMTEPAGAYPGATLTTRFREPKEIEREPGNMDSGCESCSWRQRGPTRFARHGGASLASQPSPRLGRLHLFVNSSDAWRQTAPDRPAEANPPFLHDRVAVIAPVSGGH